MADTVARGRRQTALGRDDRDVQRLLRLADGDRVAGAVVVRDGADLDRVPVGTAAEQRKARAASVADAKKRSSQREAKAELDEAAKTKQSAAESRADAERLSDLTEAKKQERKES